MLLQTDTAVLFWMAALPPSELPGHDSGEAEPDLNRRCVIATCGLPFILAPQIWFVADPKATF
jgi:hypothetical protein